VVCVDELDPVTPRFFPPTPGWSPDGHRIKAPLEYGRGPDKAWVFGALRVEDGNSLTFTSRSRNSEGYIKLLRKIERAIPKGIIHLDFSHLSQTGWIIHRPSAQREALLIWLHTPLPDLGDEATSSAPKGATPRLLGQFAGSVSCPFGTMSVLLYSRA
jgi:hypothetical protein